MSQHLIPANISISIQAFVIFYNDRATEMAFVNSIGNLSVQHASLLAQ